jgi:predicted RNase H-like HicB family nuclease
MDQHSETGRVPSEQAMKLTYAVVIERTANNYAAYAPDVPGCVSTAQTWDEMLAMIGEALTAHIEFLIEDGDPVPEPTMSIDDAIAHYSQVLAEFDADLPAEYRAAPPTISTTFSSVEIEVPVPQEVSAG